MYIYILHEYTKINSVLTTRGEQCIVQFRTFPGGSRIEFACVYIVDGQRVVVPPLL